MRHMERMNEAISFAEIEKWLEFWAADCEGLGIHCDESCPYHYYCVEISAEEQRRLYSDAIRLLREMEGRIDRLEDQLVKSDKIANHLKSCLKTDIDKRIELQRELDDALHQLTRRDLLLREMGIVIPEETEERK